MRLPTDWEENVSRLLKDRGDEQELEAARQEIWAMLRPMRDNYEKGLYRGEETSYWRKVSILRDQLDLLDPISEGDVHEAAGILLDLEERWEDATDSERKDFVHRIIQEAALDIESQQIVWLKPRLEFSVLFQLVRDLEPGEGNSFWLSGKSPKAEV